jgi:hypothetical protein
MKNITFYAQLVKIVSYILIPITIINFFIKWLFPKMIIADSFIAGFFYDSTPISTLIASMPLNNRLMAMFVDGASVSLVLIILSLIIIIMHRIQHHEIFSPTIARLFSRISQFAFWLAIYTPINKTILSVITTLHQSPHTLAVSFDIHDLFNIFIFGFVMVVTLLIEQGNSLQNEQNLTV